MRRVPPREPTPESFVPLTAVVFEILLALAGRDLHGYEVMREVEQRTGGKLLLYPGTLYRALHRLLTEGLVEEMEERPDPSLDDERRRYYRLTRLGHAVASAEARRLANQVDVARSRRLLKGSSS